MTIVRDFAFASGGIFWKIFDRTKFESKDLRHQVLILIGLILVCWLPLAGLSFLTLGWANFYHLFLRDIATQVRFLIVLPILLISRRSLNKSFNQTISFFYETKIVDDDNKQSFENVLNWLTKRINSKLVDFILLVLVYSAFYFQENSQINNSSTYAPWHLVNDHMTSAGWWYLLVSLPVLQMLLYRWLYSILLWIIFLRKISKTDLHLSALHPDGVGGLGFLQYTQLSFFPVALAFSALTAGVLNNMIMFSGISIQDYKVAIGSVLIFVFLLFIFPLMLLLPKLAQIKRKYFMLYSLEAWPFARKYEEELKLYYQTGEEKPDASWHVDLIGSFEKTRDMKTILVDKVILFAFIAAVVLPFLPVVAQQIPLKEIILNLLGKIMG
ncbi:MAG TPA: hypothetical protein VFI33_05625 [Puia sp.]|nr:hypothetical protein [Puia sp.]